MRRTLALVGAIIAAAVAAAPAAGAVFIRVATVRVHQGGGGGSLIVAGNDPSGQPQTLEVLS